MHRHLVLFFITLTFSQLALSNSQVVFAHPPFKNEKLQLIWSFDQSTQQLEYSINSNNYKTAYIAKAILKKNNRIKNTLLLESCDGSLTELAFSYTDNKATLKKTNRHITSYHTIPDNPLEYKTRHHDQKALRKYLLKPSVKASFEPTRIKWMLLLIATSDETQYSNYTCILDTLSLTGTQLDSNSKIFSRILTIPDVSDASTRITSTAATTPHQLQQYITFIDNLLKGQGYQEYIAWLQIQKTHEAREAETLLASLAFHPAKDHPYPALDFSVQPLSSGGYEHMSMAGLLARIARGYLQTDPNHIDYINYLLNNTKQLPGYINGLLDQ